LSDLNWLAAATRLGEAARGRTAPNPNVGCVIVRGDSKRDRIIGLAIAVLVTTIILIIFFVDAKINTAPPPRVVYVETYAPDRSDADIIASQKKDSAERRAFALKKQRQFQALQKRLHIE
jgi:hypothetical protein